MSYWTVIPTIVRKSKKLSAEEKELYYELYDKRNAGGWCTSSNAELAKALDCSESTISARLANLYKKKFAHAMFNVHSHQRRIYLDIPGQPSEEKKPDEKTLAQIEQEFRDVLKKSIIFGDVEPQILIQRFKESPYLDNLKDNSTQFILSEAQIKFLAKFLKYPGKKIDCQMASFTNVDYEKLIFHIERSRFLQCNENLSLRWCLEHYTDILNDKYKTSNIQDGTWKNFTERNYGKEDLNSLFQDIGDIDI